MASISYEILKAFQRSLVKKLSVAVAEEFEEIDQEEFKKFVNAYMRKLIAQPKRTSQRKASKKTSNSKLNGFRLYLQTKKTENPDAKHADLVAAWVDEDKEEWKQRADEINNQDLPEEPQAKDLPSETDEGEKSERVLTEQEEEAPEESEDE